MQVLTKSKHFRVTKLKILNNKKVWTFIRYLFIITSIQKDAQIETLMIQISTSF